jgi:hypothetical protein
MENEVNYHRKQDVTTKKGREIVAEASLFDHNLFKDQPEDYRTLVEFREQSKLVGRLTLTCKTQEEVDKLMDDVMVNGDDYLESL